MGQTKRLKAIDEAADILALDMPDACREGVAQNLDLLRTHALIVDAALTEDEPDA